MKRETVADQRKYGDGWTCETISGRQLTGVDTQNRN